MYEGVVPLYKTINTKKGEQMSDLLKRLKGAGSVKASLLSESEFFNEKEMVPTEIPIINLALSAKLKGGLSSGLGFLAGPSKHFKSLLGLILVKAYMKQHADAICLFYDSEFGITPQYIAANGIDTERVVHIPIEHLEQLKFDISKRLDEIKRGDKVIIFIDSIGNLASKKEVEDALDERSVADMSRARVMKSLWRIVTPNLTTKDIPCIAVNHTYQCGTEDMIVKTKTGDVSLKDINVGDYVLTTSGFEQVTFTVEHEDAYITDIELEDGQILSFTSGHRFKVNGKWVYVDDLEVDTELDVV
jgi:RecA/RadA recombinase